MVDFVTTGVKYAWQAPHVSRADWLDNWQSTAPLDKALLDQHGIRPDQFYAAAIYKLTKPSNPSTPALPEGYVASLIQAEIIRRRLDAPLLTYRDAVAVLFPLQDPQQTQ